MAIDVVNVHFRVPEESPSEIARKVEESLVKSEATQNIVLRMIFTVSACRKLFHKSTIDELKEAVEPFRSRVKYACVENVVVVENPVARGLARAALCVFKPEVPTKIIGRYYAKAKR